MALLRETIIASFPSARCLGLLFIVLTHFVPIASAQETHLIDVTQTFDSQGESFSFTQGFTLGRNTTLVMRFASDYKADAAILTPDQVGNFKANRPFTGYTVFDDGFGTKSVTLPAGTYYAAARNQVSSANDYRVELDTSIQLTEDAKGSYFFYDTYINEAEYVAPNGGRLWQPFTIQSGFRYFVDGANTGLKFYLFAASQFTAFRDGGRFNYYTQYSKDFVEPSGPGQFEIELPAGDYYLGFTNPNSINKAVVYTMERWRVIPKTPSGGTPGGTVHFEGEANSSISGGQINFKADRVQNDRTSTTSALRLECYATPTAYTGGNLPAGSRLVGFYTFTETLKAGFGFPNINVNVAYTQPPDGRYDVVLLLTEDTGDNTSSYAIRDFKIVDQLVIAAPVQSPMISLQPQGRTAQIGESVTFSVSASGAAPLSYQWRKDGVNISGATGATYTIPNVQVAHAGNYSVLVSNSAGNVPSGSATLSVNRLSQTITFAPLPSKQRGDPPFGLNAVASSGLPVAYTSSNPGVATVSGGTATLTGIGTAVITASQAGDTQYLPANAVSQTLTVTTSPVATYSVTLSVSPAAGGTVSGGGSYTAGRTVNVIATPASGYSFSNWTENGQVASASVNYTFVAGASRVLIANFTRTATGNRTIQVGTVSGQPRATLVAPVVLNGTGEENALSFSLSFDATKMRFTGAALGSGASIASLVVNTNQAAAGKVGVVLLLPVNRNFPAGAVELARLTWVAGSSVASVPLAFANTPVVKSVSDALGNDLSSQFLDGLITIQGGLPTAKSKADFNGDGWSDILFQDDTGALATWQMRGASLVAGSVFTPSAVVDRNYRIAASGDFNNDGKEDLLLQHTDGTLAVWFMDGTKLVSGRLLNPASPGDRNWRVVAAADFNQDGKVDLVFQHTDGTLAMWFLDGLNLISASLVTPSNPGDRNWRVVGTGDFNADGYPDFVFQHADGTLAVWWMKGASLMQASGITPPNPGAGWRVVSVADRDQDGKPDMLFQHTNLDLAVWFMDGVKLSSSTYLTPRNPGGTWKVAGPK